jgi:hypothetical protein
MPKLEALADDGGPARSLSCAPDHLRCRSFVPDDDGGSPARCSRFTIKLPGGRRDDFCISHSKTEHATRLKVKAARAQEEVLEEERERRRDLAEQLLPSPFEHRVDFQMARFYLFRARVMGLVTSEELRDLQSLVNDAERHALRPDSDWDRLYVT